MLTITDGGSLTRALRMPLDVRLKQLLLDRRDQLGGDIKDVARFIVVQPGDGLKELEQALGFNILEDGDGLVFPDPGFSGGRWDWMAFHGHCFELVFEFTCAFTHVVLIQNSPLQNRLLRALCLTFAE